MPDILSVTALSGTLSYFGVFVNYKNGKEPFILLMRLFPWKIIQNGRKALRMAPKKETLSGELFFILSAASIFYDAKASLVFLYLFA